MRITGGKLKGHNLTVPQVSDLRPTQDIVRKAIFDILDHSLMPSVGNEGSGREPVTHTLHDQLVLDLYAGTGALGIEALSRGAQFVDFVERDEAAVNAIKQNLNHTHLLGKADIYQQKAQDFVRSERPEKYDLIFLDPPYADEPRQVLLALPRLLNPCPPAPSAAGDGRRAKGLIIYLHSQQVVLDATSRAWLSKKLRVIDNRTYGATTVTFLKKHQDNNI